MGEYGSLSSAGYASIYEKASHSPTSPPFFLPLSPCEHTARWHSPSLDSRDSVPAALPPLVFLFFSWLNIPHGVWLELSDSACEKAHVVSRLKCLIFFFPTLTSAVPSNQGMTGDLSSTNQKEGFSRVLQNRPQNTVYKERFENSQLDLGSKVFSHTQWWYFEKKGEKQDTLSLIKCWEVLK